MKVQLVLSLLLATPAMANSITAPLEGNVTLTELRHLVEAGPLVWTTDGDMVIAQYWDEEPGVGATIKHPVSILDTSETPTSTTAVLSPATIMKMATCGRYQLDFERYPLDHSTIKTLVVDTERRCDERIPPTPETPTPELIPEATTSVLIGAGLLVLAVWMKRTSTSR